MRHSAGDSLAGLGVGVDAGVADAGRQEDLLRVEAVGFPAVVEVLGSFDDVPAVHRLAARRHDLTNLQDAADVFLFRAVVGGVPLGGDVEGRGSRRVADAGTTNDRINIELSPYGKSVL